jgi:hypothetical protein
MGCILPEPPLPGSPKHCAPLVIAHDIKNPLLSIA